MYTLKYGSSSIYLFKILDQKFVSVTFHMVFFVSIPTQIILTNTSTLCQLNRYFLCTWSNVLFQDISELLVMKKSDLYVIRAIRIEKKIFIIAVILRLLID